ncbi:MAG: adaptor protein MecA [Lachnospiraceae bacterium]|nr:adaptor protein MecA [Lachnospiraceae bacterium]
MKIEKISENQIRCTLTKEDLASRELKISELAYGTEKAKNLFRDMIQQASFEFGFEAEDIPLMIEAVPLNSDCLVLLITKVEDPEELDTRFARFAPSVTEDEEDEPDAPDEVLELFRRLKEPAAKDSETPSARDIPSDPEDRTLIFQMDSLQQVMNAAAVIGSRYQGESILYKDKNTGKYLLVLQQDGVAPEVFHRVCNTISEYGTPKHSPAAGRRFLEEHCEALIASHALQQLSGK